MSKISYVVPVYHNQGSIRLTWEAIRELFAGPLSKHDYEILFIDDGSHDNSYVEMQEVAAMDPNVRTIVFGRNYCWV